MFQAGCRCLLSLICLGMMSSAFALSSNEAKQLATGETDTRIKTLAQLVSRADEGAYRLIKAMNDDAVKIAGDHILIIEDGKAIDAVSGEATNLPDSAEDVISNNRMRAELESAMAALRLLSKNPATRLEAAQALLKEPDAEKISLLRKALASESESTIKSTLSLALAAASLGDPDPAIRLNAAKEIASYQTPQTILLLNQRLADETVPEVRAAVAASLREVQAALQWGDKLGVLFTGLSLGSILLLAALGLAVTYGLMGVINMAHGELIMIGAYATYVVQGLFRTYLPDSFNAYLLVAVPAAFCVSALVGAFIERLVLRHLYGRPLETLLATWGISLILIQGVRSVFGAQNVAVENPAWLSGGWQALPNLTLPYNRIVIIMFAVLVLIGMALLISKTRLGLFVRGVTQNRTIAASMGVNTARIDTLAFALGSGIAGLAGAALSQVGNVGPDLGQNYIVDSFMVVVLGGVGQLAGTVYAALGLGVLNKLLEGVAGAVLAKIAVLVMIVIFIQKRPQGIFALKGRSAEA
ncbi:MAG: High-affinity branched-chain amino acid transport system permease protein LivH [Pseudomonadota bacterium]|jgi:urea transport system permease protein